MRYHGIDEEDTNPELSMTKVMGVNLFCLAQFEFPNQIKSNGLKIFSQDGRVTSARLQVNMTILLNSFYNL